MANFRQVDDDSEEYNPFQEGPSNSPLPVFTRKIEQVDAVDSVIDEIDETEEELENLASELSDVELRLEEANCYKALLHNPLFTNPSTVARNVEKRVREFIKSELKSLLGLEKNPIINAPTYKSPFSQEEEQVLKQLANKVLTKENKPNSPVAAPQVTPVAAPTMPMVNAISDPTSPPAAPQAQPKPKPKGRPPKKQTEYIEVERNINGKTVKLKIDKMEQTQPAPGTKRYPKLSPEEEASYIATNMIIEPPKSGATGKAYQLVTKKNGE